jgi:hypothetical protein
MNSNPHNPTTSEPPSALVNSPAEETLRLIASSQAPDGLEDRVKAAVSAETSRDRVHGRGRVLAWPRAIRPESSWMRTAAAAAIVFVIAGGGWGVYTRVERSQTPKVIVMPARIPAAGGFSGAGAIRTPLTLPGPAAPQPANANKPTKADAARPKTVKKPLNRPKASSSGQPSGTGGGATRPDASR